MSIGGGTFTVQNKTLPGTYINFVSQTSTVSTAERGIVALPLPLHWGPEKTLMTINSDEYYDKALSMLGYGSVDENLLLIRQALTHATTLLLYRADVGGTKASASITGLSVNANYTGIRGNDLKIAVVTNGDDLDVVTYLDGAEVDRQTTDSDGVGLAANDYVTFAVTALSAVASLPLTGGLDGEDTTQSYADFLALLEPETFNVVGYAGTDVSVKALFVAFAKRLHDEEGKKIVAVISQYTLADSIAVISVDNGVILSDGTVIAANDAVCWVAGASAGAEINESLTNMAYDDAVDVDTKYTSSGYEAALEAGQFVFYLQSGTVRVLSDINTLVTFSTDVSEDWTSNRVVRVMDGWANDVTLIFTERYLGTQTNSATGQSLFKADLVTLGKQYASIDAISDFSADDIEVGQGDGKRDLLVSCALTPNDSMEKLYMTVNVQ
ncbi:phage tail sheath family protein [Bengtsoniella intestinalis]|uniref:phage tail sheath family protein n=1 Tax=Bengtsoniella intestinalis TaxID=3073143 RepID=UPI00391F897A